VTGVASPCGCIALWLYRTVVSHTQVGEFSVSTLIVGYGAGEMEGGTGGGDSGGGRRSGDQGQRVISLETIDCGVIVFMSDLVQCQLI